MNEEKLRQELKTAAPLILAAYNYKAENSYTERIGVIDCQVLRALITEDDEQNGVKKAGSPALTQLKDKYERSEFVAEHEGRSAFLFGLVSLWRAFFEEGDSWSRSGPLAMELMFMLMHDIGEVKGGDVADDGRAEHQKRVREEGELMRMLFNLFPPDTRGYFHNFRRDFETFSGSGRVAKTCDKIEALLFLLFLESKGHVGYTELRAAPSPGDLRACKLLGTDVCTDAWCLRYRIQSRNIPDADRFPFEEVLRQQFISVRKELPLCMTIDVTNLEIDTPPTKGP